jgi:hypothetical protein
LGIKCSFTRFISAKLNFLSKLRNRVELRALFLDWEFSAWGAAAEDRSL